MEETKKPNKERIGCLMEAMRTVEKIQRLNIEAYRVIVEGGYRVAR